MMGAMVGPIYSHCLVCPFWATGRDLFESNYSIYTNIWNIWILKEDIMLLNENVYLCHG